MIDPGPRSLEELEARLARDLDLLTLPPAEWVPPRPDELGRSVLDVAVVGAGMAGLTAAFALRKLGIANVRLFDRAPAGREGPWGTFARMETLRSPKTLTGPALGFANLTFRAWYEARFGREAWEALFRIPRLQWLDYLTWYRRVTNPSVENDTTLTRLSGDADGVTLNLEGPEGTRAVRARRVVLANGRDGLGGPFIPPFWRNVDKRFWAHAHETIDFADLAGKTVAVLGAGAGAVDNAAEALESGAGKVYMLVRRKQLPRVNKSLAAGNAGILLGFNDLSDERRWAQNQYIADTAVPAPHNSMLRCSRHANFSLLTGCAVEAARVEGGRLALDTTRGPAVVDFVILATGFTVDWARRPELADLARHALLWRDRYVAPGREGSEFAEHPYLGRDFQFQERTPGAAPWLPRVHAFNYAAVLSHGRVTGDIPGISAGAERLAAGIAGALFAEDYDHHWQRLQSFETPELLGDEWTEAEGF
ncbi:FAD/NAD(P)-binding protein [Azospirillum rugosum]|uniref:Cation diffusion facilitator CzcD-associated flavoprotein CzcO n=1 Tax=Azospirillum rugosum TaxID=416170 RepID=A0ABS4SJT2_9PROT|nr:NAD(P)/FAD-dependent oxidoreductase [Azospirillum rugosum]MBP2292816.1 cation diffusion facilitator CzcD-associated flavoprotein CzcO [Azospirillum rugosum]MDQ0527075.1 cation diffusion facilitator CzcD-associated flavoprotein CzcO [Azospirillum rugosum]